MYINIHYTFSNLKEIICLSNVKNNSYTLIACLFFFLYNELLVWIIQRLLYFIVPKSFYNLMSLLEHNNMYIM